jgi:DNA-binding CsgD family transcriptional regulator
VVGVAAAEFLIRATECKSEDVLHSHFLAFAQGLGFQSAMLVNLSNAGGPVMPRVVLGDLDPWIEYYTDQNYAGLDPSIPRAFRSRAPFTWASVERPGASKRVRHFFGEARESWAEDGLIVPIHGPFGEFSVVNLLANHAITLSDEEIAIIKGVCQIYVAVGLTLASGALPLPADDMPNFSRRERQCLYWMSMGKHDADTAKILGISAHTVRGYLDTAKVKLGVETRPELSLRALASGLLVPDRGGMF